VSSLLTDLAIVLRMKTPVVFLNAIEESMKYSLLLLLITALSASAEDYHTNPNCWSEARIVHSNQSVSKISEYSLSIARKNLPLKEIQYLFGKEAVYSDNKAYSFRLNITPDTKRSAENVSLWVFNERPYIIHLSTRGVLGIRDVKWVNEKWIFMRVWWGRIAGFDYLFDVEREEFVSTQPFQWGQIAFQQWKQACESPEWKDEEVCKKSCYSLK
jgi:hypothetical protein